jgi:hypothetical protein
MTARLSALRAGRTLPQSFFIFKDFINNNFISQFLNNNFISQDVTHVTNMEEKTNFQQ